MSECCRSSQHRGARYWGGHCYQVHLQWEPFWRMVFESFHWRRKEQGWSLECVTSNLQPHLWTSHFPGKRTCAKLNNKKNHLSYQVLDYFSHMKIHMFGQTFFYKLKSDTLDKVVWLTWSDCQVIREEMKPLNLTRWFIFRKQRSKIWRLGKKRGQQYNSPGMESLTRGVIYNVSGWYIKIITRICHECSAKRWFIQLQSQILFWLCYTQPLLFLYVFKTFLPRSPEQHQCSNVIQTGIVVQTV